MKLILGPCAIESWDHAKLMVNLILESIHDLDVDFYYKSSFDKANRSSIDSGRGVGLEQGADILQRVREDFKVKTLTDVHETWQCERLKRAVDVLQIPAFLCRQTDLLLAAGEATHSVNIKKGQFLAPWDMKNVIDKLPANDVWITERGSSFGYNTLVVDYRGLVTMAEWGHPVIFDATHSVQQPGGLGKSSGGQRQFVEPLARAAMAVGVDGLFIETHDCPERAPSDGPNQIPVTELKNILQNILKFNK
jgi:2-dehydro-3-deoxyphosphooctonate aldolase (KDO 8-P synthase)